MNPSVRVFDVLSTTSPAHVEMLPRQSPPRRLQGPRAFTLVELLVVIGIIAVLISILLPTLNAARRSAYVVQCSSNMKQIATAMIMYAQDHKGKLPPSAAAPGLALSGYSNGNGVGWWWPNELVRRKYINNPALNVYKKTPSLQTEKVFASSNVFRCPEGISEDYKLTSQNYPTDGGNNSYDLENDGTNPGQAAAEGFGVPSWYQLASRVQTATNAYTADPNATGAPTKPGARQSPFMWFNSGATHNDLHSPAYQRSLSLIKRGAEVVMIVEAANPNWYDQTASTTNNGETVWLRRLGARHGKKSKGGLNADTNIAFFDGHVAKFNTAPLAVRKDGTGDQLDLLTQETIFFLNLQRGK